MNRTCGEPHRKHHDLSCFEYVDIYGEKKSCFQCFCSCDALDTACERAVSCDFATADLLDSGNSYFSNLHVLFRFRFLC